MKYKLKENIKVCFIEKVIPYTLILMVIVGFLILIGEIFAFQKDRFYPTTDVSIQKVNELGIKEINKNEIIVRVMVVENSRYHKRPILQSFSRYYLDYRRTTGDVRVAISEAVGYKPSEIIIKRSFFDYLEYKFYAYFIIKKVGE